MKLLKFLYIFFQINFFLIQIGYTQVVNTATMDTLESTVLGHLGIGGYVDTYYSYNFNRPQSGTNNYLISSSRNNEVSINLAYIDIRYRSQQVRGRFVPGFGTYMNANYVLEPGTLGNILEGYVGIKPFKNKNIWIDMGVLGSPYTNESAISKDHLMYTRSLAPENVPYYLSGLKASIPLQKKLNLYLYFLNGWQVIQDNNNAKSFGTQFEFRPTNNLLLNLTTYVGDERSTLNPNYRIRYFLDLYTIYQPSEKFSFTSSIYAGIQQHENISSTKWWQINAIGRYSFNSNISLSGRVEYFHDPTLTIIKTPNNTEFKASSAGLCLNIKIGVNALFRLEHRSFFSSNNLFENDDASQSKNCSILTSNITVWF